VILKGAFGNLVEFSFCKLFISFDSRNTLDNSYSFNDFRYFWFSFDLNLFKIFFVILNVGAFGNLVEFSFCKLFISFDSRNTLDNSESFNDFRYFVSCVMILYAFKKIVFEI